MPLDAVMRKLTETFELRPVRARAVGQQHGSPVDAGEGHALDALDAHVVARSSRYPSRSSATRGCSSTPCRDRRSAARAFDPDEEPNPWKRSRRDADVHARGDLRVGHRGDGLADGVPRAGDVDDLAEGGTEPTACSRASGCRWARRSARSPRRSPTLAGAAAGAELRLNSGSNGIERHGRASAAGMMNAAAPSTARREMRSVMRPPVVDDQFRCTSDERPDAGTRA